MFGFSKSPTCCIANRPTSLLFCLELSVLEKVNQGRDEIRIDHRLNLVEVAGSDVGYCPAGFFSDCLLGTGEETQEGGESAAIDDNLCLYIIAGNNIAH